MHPARPVRLRRGYYTDTGEDAREVVLEGLDLPITRARLAEWLAAWPEAHDYELRLPESGA